METPNDQPGQPDGPSPEGAPLEQNSHPKGSEDEPEGQSPSEIFAGSEVDFENLYGDDSIHVEGFEARQEDPPLSQAETAVLDSMVNLGNWDHGFDFWG